MRLDDERESNNIDDERNAGGSGFGGGMGGGFGGGGLRIGGIGAIILVVGALFFGVDPRLVLNLISGGGTEQTDTRPPSSSSSDEAPAQSEMPRQTSSDPSATINRATGAEDPQKRFVAKVLASTEDVWTRQFQAMGRQYRDPKLVLFTGGMRSGCGMAETATGPFYCPADQRVYLDLDFFREMQTKLGAPGQFARAYVIAHEVGHHVQDELGTMDKVTRRRQSLDEIGRNALSVRVELQADCYAGIWAHQANDAKQILESGDIESGIGAASAVGDDRLQRQARGTVEPETFTHGSSAQRVRWFRRGLDSGRLDQCDTFGASSL